VETMEIDKMKAIIEAILFASGRPVEIKELISALELPEEDIIQIIESMKADFQEANRGIEIIKVESGYTLCSKKEYYDYIYPLFDNRAKPNISNAAMETLAIIAYNPKITRAEIESIRGVNSDATIYKLLEYNLIEDAGKSDLPGKPTVYQTTEEFLKTFGISNLDELPELPRYRLDENEQIVIDDIIDKNKENQEE
jgi:segregation and condensation protein B